MKHQNVFLWGVRCRRSGVAVVYWTAKLEVRGSNPGQGRSLDEISAHTWGRRVVDNIWHGGAVSSVKLTTVVLFSLGGGID